MTNQTSGNHLFLRALQAEGVQYLFGNPGTSEGPMIGVLHEYPDLEYLMVLQEGVAVGMADSYARATGEVACVSLHIDNGLANGFGLMVDMKRAGTPVVVAAGNKDARHLASGRSDLARMAEPFAKWSAEITHADQIPSVVRRAFQEARTPPTGPVFVGISTNAFEDSSNLPTSPSVQIPTKIEPDSDAVAIATDWLADAEDPVVVVGDRVHQFDAVNDVVRLAEILGAPVYGHVSGNRNFPTQHPLWAQQLSLRTPDGIGAVANSDVVVAIGCPVFDDFFYHHGGFLTQSTKLIQIDINAEEIGKSEPVDIGIFASPGAAAHAIGNDLENRMTAEQADRATERAKRVAASNVAIRREWDETADSNWNRVPINPASFGKALGNALPNGANLFNDSISTSANLQMGIAHRTDLNVFGPRGGAIGWGIGSTLGLHVACPDKPTFGVVGDGSAMMTVQGLWTAINYDIPAIFIICNNASYRVLKVNQNHYHRINDLPPPEIYNAADFDTPLDFRAQAEAYGALGIRVEHLDDLAPAINEAVSAKAPAVIDVILDGSV